MEADIPKQELLSIQDVNGLFLTHVRIGTLSCKMQTDVSWRNETGAKTFVLNTAIMVSIEVVVIDLLYQRLILVSNRVIGTEG